MSLSLSAADELPFLQRMWRLFLALGVLAAVAGLVAIAMPHVATEATVVVLGILLLLQGGGELGHAVMVRDWRGFALHLLAAALYLFVGVFILEDRERAARVLTQLLGAVYLVGGVLRLVFAVVSRVPAWPWLALTGAVDILLGVIIMGAGPEAGLWVIGTLVGIDLLFHGLSMVALAFAVRSATAPAAGPG